MQQSCRPLSESNITHTSSSPNHSHYSILHHHHHPELSTTQRASSSSNSSILSRRHDVVLCPSDTGTARFISRRGANTAANDLSSYFSKDIEQEQEYFQQILGSSSFGWTDEKHSSYLDSMEADFLGSVMFGGNAHADQEASSDLCDSASSQQVKSSKEFKVCQNGRWRPKSLNASPYVGPIAQVAVVVKNPWIKRFRSSSKPRVSPTLFLEDPLVQEGDEDMNTSKHLGDCEWRLFIAIWV